jgi:hypothetical protein
MHPVFMRQLAADRISEMHAKAEDERLARQARRARRGVPSTRPMASHTITTAQTAAGHDALAGQARHRHPREARRWLGSARTLHER